MFSISNTTVAGQPLGRLTLGVTDRDGQRKEIVMQRDEQDPTRLIPQAPDEITPTESTPVRIFMVVLFGSVRDHIVHIHAAGCPDLHKPRYQNERPFEWQAQTAEQAARFLFSDEIDRGYEIGRDIKIFPCCKHAPEIIARNVKAELERVPDETPLGEQIDGGNDEFAL